MKRRETIASFSLFYLPTYQATEEDHAQAEETVEVETKDSHPPATEAVEDGEARETQQVDAKGPPLLTSEEEILEKTRAEEVSTRPLSRAQRRGPGELARVEEDNEGHSSQAVPSAQAEGKGSGSEEGQIPNRTLTSVLSRIRALGSQQSERVSVMGSERCCVA